MAITGWHPRARHLPARLGAGGRLATPLQLAAVGATLAWVRFVLPCFATLWVPSATPATPEAFANAALGGHQLRRAGAERGEVTMYGGARKVSKTQRPKPTRIANQDRIKQRKYFEIPKRLQKLARVPELYMPEWSQTLRLTFLPEEHDLVSEKDLIDHFTTDDYAPEAIILKHKMAHSNLTHAYVHFDSNPKALQAKKEKKGLPIGAATEVGISLTGEKKWIRLRDGVRLEGPPRQAWHKAYGNDVYDQWGTQWFPDTGTRNNPVYPC